MVVDYTNIAQIRNIGSGAFEVDIFCTDVEFVTLYDEAVISDTLRVNGGGFFLQFRDVQPLAIDMAANVLRLKVKSLTAC